MSKNTKLLLVAILLLGAGLRLIGITKPLLGHHNWRQTETAAMARNFLTERFNLFYPRIDWRGTTTGEVECEFPIYQFTIATLYKCFGVHEAIGRGLSIIFSLLAVLGTFFLGRRIGNTSIALWASFFMATLPLPTFFGRAVMPESTLLFACIYAVLFFDRWADSGSWRDLLFSSVFLITACLLKPPTLYLGLPLGFLAFRRYRAQTLLRPELWVYGILLLTALCAWYIHSYRLQQTTGLSFGMWEYGTDKWGNWDLVLSWPFWERMLIDRIPQILLAYLGLPLLAIGIIRPPETDKEKLFLFWKVGILIFIVIVAQGVFVHDYYLLPASVPATYFMGKAAAWGVSRQHGASKKARIVIIILVLGTLGLSIGRHYRWIYHKALSRYPAYELAVEASRIIPENTLVITVSPGNPHPLTLYYSKTKGWDAPPTLLSEEWVQARTKSGAEYILGVHKDFRETGAEDVLNRLLTEYKVILDNERFFIVGTTPDEPE